MARTPRTPRGRGKAKTSIRVDLSNVGKAFEPGQEYAVRIIECTVEEGTKAPYFNVKLAGLEDSDYETSYMYHRASTAEGALFRLRPFLEAFGFDIPDGPLDIDAADFVGREAMCSTFLDRYDGGSSVKPDEFWPLEDGEKADGAEDAGEFDLDELDDDQIKALAEALEVEVKGRSSVTKLKKALAEMDEDEVEEAWAELNEEAEPEPEPEPKGRKSRRKDPEPEPEEKPKGRKARGKKKAEAITEDEVQDANEDELEEIIERFELDVDLGDFKTLRKMKNAVIDALEEGGHFEG